MFTYIIVFVCPCLGTVYVGSVLFLFGQFDSMSIRRIAAMPRSTVAEGTRINCGVGRCSVQPLAKIREAAVLHLPRHFHDFPILAETPVRLLQLGFEVGCSDTTHRFLRASFPREEGQPWYRQQYGDHACTLLDKHNLLAVWGSHQQCGDHACSSLDNASFSQ